MARKPKTAAEARLIRAAIWDAETDDCDDDSLLKLRKATAAVVRERGKR